LKPALDRSRSLKEWARRWYAPPRPDGAGSARHRRDLSPDAVRRSLDESLRLLKRSRADIFLAHDPTEDSFTDETTAIFESLRSAGVVGCYGIAVTEAIDAIRSFGDVWQSGWPRRPDQAYHCARTYVHHGIIRSAAKHRNGETVEAPDRLVEIAMATAPEAVFLLSASSPDRLRAVVASVTRSAGGGG
jgi:hypothetical protein